MHEGIAPPRDAGLPSTSWGGGIRTRDTSFAAITSLRRPAWADKGVHAGSALSTELRPRKIVYLCVSYTHQWGPQELNLHHLCPGKQLQTARDADKEAQSQHNALPLS